MLQSSGTGKLKHNYVKDKHYDTFRKGFIKTGIREKS